MFRSWFKESKGDPAIKHLHRVEPFEGVHDSEVVSRATATAWESVSLSRSQFDELYIGTIRNVAVYMQDKNHFSPTILHAATELQSTQITKLPYKRPREEAAKHEQLWKYTLFCCHMLKGAASIDRRFYNQHGARQLYPDLENPNLYFDDKPCKRAVLLTQSLSSLLPGTAATWLLSDDERCLEEILNAVLGLPCFIDTQTPIETPIRQPEAVQPPQALSEAESQNVSFIEKVQEDEKRKITKHQETTSELTDPSDIPSIQTFENWLDRKKLPERDGALYFKSRETVERFLESQDSECAVGYLQEKLIEDGYRLETIRGSKNKKMIVMFLPEKSNV